MSKIDAQFIRGVIGSHNLIVDERPQIAFIGRSNVGKSSVINTLVDRQGLVKSSSTPGKTREINFFLIQDTHYFVDLPGYGYAKFSQKQREKLRRLILWYFISGEAPVTLVVLIIDAKAGLREFDYEMIGVLEEYEHPYIIVANKTDKLNQKNLHKALEEIQEDVGQHIKVFPLSAKTGKGKEKLLKEVFNL